MFKAGFKSQEKSENVSIVFYLFREVELSPGIVENVLQIHINVVLGCLLVSRFRQ